MIFLKNAKEKIVLFIWLLVMMNPKIKKYQNKLLKSLIGFIAYHENKMQVRKPKRLQMQ